MVNLFMGLSIRRCSIKFINIKMRKYFTSDSEIFGYGKVYYSNSIKVSLFVCLMCHEEVCGNGFTDPSFLDLGNSWR
jgi:hypothetical protein